MDDEFSRPAKRPRRDTSMPSSFTIDIPLHPTYYRGAHPPPGKIQLLPEHSDNTAYIIEKIIDPNGRKLPETARKRPFYIIGWRDPELREARVGVECMRAYTYVSPRQVEEFEYQDLLAREAAEEQEARKEIDALISQQQQRQESQPAGAPRKRGRPGRPPKKKATADEDESHRVPSLSTPQKSRLNLSADNLQDLQNEMEDRIRSQNNTMVLDDDEDDEAEEDDEDEDEMLQRVLLQQAERNNKAERLDSDFTIAIPSRSAPRTQPASRRGRGPGRPPKVKPLDSHQTVVPRAEPSRRGSGVRPTRGTKQRVPDRSPAHAPQSRQSTPAPSLSESTIVARPAFPKQASLVSLHDSSISSRSGGSPKDVPIAQRTTSAKTKRESTTPIPLPSYVTSMSKDATPSPGLPPLPKAHEDEAVTDEAMDVDAPDEWEVLRLDGVRVEEHDGVKTRYFKVRWKGDWPPDQNPSWESEDCIDRATVKAFLKLRKEKKQEASTKFHPETSTASPRPASAKTQGTLKGWLQPGRGAAPAA
ncbi:hypothetical protein MCOR02_010244 [Pyricularia oryzae]|uniref:Chromo domain-containing protein n=1 Tax=Pyricularia oryzae TaxID=318829 RepID=A0A4P7NP87_PYROR|nr:hypothetical protein MCOR02_010244 [Pyricularia oryzae]KAI6320883.1 hypothetical protein MCOR34_002806 [Pyricularia oryzae]KAI6476641.1 hypothetical protein MCOR17_000976 [Pyricularia oryzae]KAI6482323.1 hypothetical protein MCOR13_010554 [Pyricularia oryzae]KAI6592169.1 hypothetical protein MCOR04_003601 [Pyricularia oryzae]